MREIIIDDIKAMRHLGKWLQAGSVVRLYNPTTIGNHTKVLSGLQKTALLTRYINHHSIRNKTFK